MKFITTPVNIPLYGHALWCTSTMAHEPHVTGTFAEDPVTGNDGKTYAVFTVSDPAADETAVTPDGEPALPFPSSWAGVYRIDVTRIKANIPYVIASEG